MPRIEKENKRRVGIIGCGRIFPRHLEAIESNSDHYVLSAVCDIDETTLKNREKIFQVPGFLDFQEMLSDMKGKLDFIVVATPNNCHYDQIVNSLKAGYNVLAEKPVDFSHKRIKEIGKLADENGREAYCVLQVRYNPTIDMVKNVLKEGLLGDIMSVSLTQRWQRPLSYYDAWFGDSDISGGVLYEVGVHYLDILQLLFGVPAVKSSSVFTNKHKHIGFEDTVFSIVQFPSGASGSIEVTIASEPLNLECSISIMGTEGYMRIGGKALDAIEDARFSNTFTKKRWKEMEESYGNGIEPNSYGVYSGSCPNHPTLYQEIAKGRGFHISEAANSVELIEEIYNKRV